MLVKHCSFPRTREGRTSVLEGTVGRIGVCVWVGAGGDGPSPEIHPEDTM